MSEMSVSILFQLHMLHILRNRPLAKGEKRRILSDAGADEEGIIFIDELQELLQQCFAKLRMEPLDQELRLLSTTSRAYIESDHRRDLRRTFDILVGGYYAGSASYSLWKWGGTPWSFHFNPEWIRVVSSLIHLSLTHQQLAALSPRVIAPGVHHPLRGFQIAVLHQTMMGLSEEDAILVAEYIGEDDSEVMLKNVAMNHLNTDRICNSPEKLLPRDRDYEGEGRIEDCKSQQDHGCSITCEAPAGVSTPPPTASPQSQGEGSGEEDGDSIGECAGQARPAIHRCAGSQLLSGDEGIIPRPVQFSEAGVQPRPHQGLFGQTQSQPNHQRSRSL